MPGLASDEVVRIGAVRGGSDPLRVTEHLFEAGVCWKCCRERDLDLDSMTSAAHAAVTAWRCTAEAKGANLAAREFTATTDILTGIVQVASWHMRALSPANRLP